ncbi:hypothetical protein AK812_SmicGene34836 [Symbiodinium microadriaticum]|uniref:Protein kinase domain-containing protein n=2 Tax=Symbiodinium microadriaticum TaxID=2951 RepID=A0A1Q9CN01_SYMMI|nr:hypothetical protein AK812_SmicGene34836 [Symbiodinium microadriaticum]
MHLTLRIIAKKGCGPADIAAFLFQTGAGAGPKQALNRSASEGAQKPAEADCGLSLDAAVSNIPLCIPSEESRWGKMPAIVGHRDRTPAQMPALRGPLQPFYLMDLVENPSLSPTETCSDLRHLAAMDEELQEPASDPGERASLLTLSDANEYGLPYDKAICDRHTASMTLDWAGSTLTQIDIRTSLMPTQCAFGIRSAQASQRDDAYFDFVALEVAEKVAISPKGKMAEAQLLLRREAIILQSLDHPNTLKIRGLRCQNGVYFMIMDKFDCNLGEWLQHRQINCQDMLTAAFQVATPVQYLHSMNTFHCGVKITNYFMDFKKDADDCPTIVLAYAEGPKLFHSDEFYPGYFCGAGMLVGVDRTLADEDHRPSIQAVPKLPSRARRKVIEVKKLVSEQSRIKTAVEASDLAHAQGYLELESQLREFMAEVEEKRASAEAVILDLVKELVRTAQEVESMNAQGALVEERLDAVEAHLQDLESNWPSKGSDAQEPHVLEDPGLEEDDTLPFAPLSRSAAGGAVRASHTLGWSRPSEQMRSRREVATWGGSGFVAPGEKLLSKAQALNTRSLGGVPPPKAAAKVLTLEKLRLTHKVAKLKSELGRLGTPLREAAPGTRAAAPKHQFNFRHVADFKGRPMRWPACERESRELLRLHIVSEKEQQSEDVVPQPVRFAPRAPAVIFIRQCARTGRLFRLHIVSEKAPGVGAQKLVEAAAAKAAAEALEKAKTSLSELREELRSDLAATVAAEKEKAVESFAALEKALTAQVESTMSELTALAGPQPRLPIDPRERAGSQESQVQGGPDAAGLTPRVAEPSQGDMDSPKAWTAKKPRTSFRVLGALVPACLGVLKKPTEVENPADEVLWSQRQKPQQPPCTILDALFYCMQDEFFLQWFVEGSAMTKSLDSTFLEVDQRIVEEISCYRNDQRDKDEILSIVEKHGWALRYAPPLFKYSEEICVAAVKSYPLVLEFISPDMRENEKVVKQAVSQCGMALLFATTKMRSRRDVVMKAVQNCGLALEFAHPDQKKQPAVVYTAVQQAALCAFMAYIHVTSRSLLGVDGELPAPGLLAPADGSQPEAVLSTGGMPWLTFEMEDASESETPAVWHLGECRVTLKQELQDAEGDGQAFREQRHSSNPAGDTSKTRDRRRIISPQRLRVLQRRCLHLAHHQVRAMAELDASEAQTSEFRRGSTRTIAENAVDNSLQQLPPRRIPASRCPSSATRRIRGSRCREVLELASSFLDDMHAPPACMAMTALKQRALRGRGRWQLRTSAGPRSEEDVDTCTKPAKPPKLALRSQLPGQDAQSNLRVRFVQRLAQVTKAKGSEQGDPLLPALFALGVTAALRAMQADLLPNKSARAFLDDTHTPPASHVAPRSGSNAWSITCFPTRTCCSTPLIKTRVWNAAGILPRRAPAPPDPGSDHVHIWVGDASLPTYQQGLKVLAALLGTDVFVAAHLHTFFAALSSSFSPTLPDLMVA